MYYVAKKWNYYGLVLFSRMLQKYRIINKGTKNLFVQPVNRINL